MANSRQMAQAISQVFDVPQVRAEVVSRTLMEHGLRASGGRGRGATAMTGRDIFNVAIAVASDIGMRDAPDFVKNVEEMRLVGEPLEGMDVAPTFGPFISSWIDGAFEDMFDWREAEDLELRLSHIGPTVEFAFKDKDREFCLRYAAHGQVAEKKPGWERVTVLRGEVFQEFAKILSGA